MNERLDRTIADWTRLGAGFGGQAAAESPDVERLLLETARLMAGMPRLFLMAATWLNRFGDVVARHRLKRLIRDELEGEHRPALGLLLDVAQQGTHPPRFAAVIRELSPTVMARPLFEVERASPALAARAHKRASAISLRWGLWCEEAEFKDDALRPASWMMRENPGLITRADFRGDLRASVLVALQRDEGAGDSEMQLARQAGGSRAQVRSALENLELTGRARRVRSEGARRTRIGLIGAML